MEIKIKKLSPDAVIPSNATGIEAGYDLYSTEEAWLRPLERKLFKTNIALEIPTGYYGHICDRSGNAYKIGIHTLAGIIDESYRGDVGVVLYNTNGGGEENSIKIFKGMKIAQILFKKCERVEFIEVENLSDSERGQNGYGSSDKNNFKKHA